MIVGRTKRHIEKRNPETEMKVERQQRRKGKKKSGDTRPA
jgi:hypothetical protein